MKRTAYVRSRSVQLRFWSGAEELNGDVRSLLADACGAAGCSIEDLLSPSRRQPVVVARRRVAADLRRLGWSYPAIGRIMQRHHSSIIGLISRGCT